jgi:ComF family protein
MLIDWLLPPVCLGCGVLLRGRWDGELCRTCATTSPAFPPELQHADGIWAVAPYEGPLAQTLLRLKLHGDLAAAGPLGRWLARSLAWHTVPFDAIVPVPLHVRRRLARGFDQVELLLTHARRCGPPAAAPILRGVLIRQRSTQSQTRLAARDRAANVQDAFVVVQPSAVAGRTVLLVDDVTTTGATLRAARDALRRAGAARVVMLALLRTLA